MAGGSFIGRIKVLLGLDSGEFTKGVQKGRKDMSGFQKFSSSWAGKMTSIFAGVFAVGVVKDFGVEASKLAGEMEGVSEAFNRLGDVTLLDRLREATKGTVSDLELMKNAVKAKNLGVPVQQLGTFFEFARRRAKETGESVEFLTESIVTGIGRKSPLILDNLGISASALSEEFKRTGDFGKAAANIVESELSKMGQDIDTSAESAAQLSAAFDNMKVVAGGLINEGLSLIVPELIKISNQMKELTDSKTLTWFEKLAGIVDANVGRIILQYNGQINKVISAQKNLNQVNKVASQINLNLKNAVQSGKITREEYSRQLANLKLALDKKTASLKINNKEVVDAKAVTRELTDEEKKHIQSVNELKLQLAALNEELGIKEYKGIDNLADAFKNALKPLKEVVKQVEDADTKADHLFKKLTGAQIQDSPLDMWAEKQLAAISNLNQALSQAVQETAGLMIDGLAMAFEGASMEGIASSFLQGFADILQQFGKMLITLGLGLQAFQASLSTLNPAVAIGAGVALLAIAGGIKSFLQKSAQSGGSGGGQGGSGGGSNFGAGLQGFESPQSGGQGGGENIQFRIQGKDLVGLSNRYNKTNTLTT